MLSPCPFFFGDLESDDMCGEHVFASPCFVRPRTNLELSCPGIPNDVTLEAAVITFFSLFGILISLT